MHTTLGKIRHNFGHEIRQDFGTKSHTTLGKTGRDLIRLWAGSDATCPNWWMQEIILHSEGIVRLNFFDEFQNHT